MIGQATLASSVATGAFPGSGQASTAADHPGRWLGGAIGGLAAAGAAVLMQIAFPPTTDSTISLVGIALLGIPVAFALGRALFPYARESGWRWALVVGLAFGLIAPPIGALLVVFGPFLLPMSPAQSEQQAFLIVVLPIGFVVSYVIAWMTIPIGVVTALITKAVPAETAVALRAPRSLEAMGVRHAVLGAVVWALVMQLVASR